MIVGRRSVAPLLLVAIAVSCCSSASRGQETEAQPAAPSISGSDPARSERIRDAKMPEFDRAVLFHTPEADAIVSALEIFPPEHPLNQVVSDWPLHPHSDPIVAAVGEAKPLRYNLDMAYVLVSPNQPRVTVQVVQYARESDRGPFPVPDNAPIEGWPASYERAGRPITLEDLQRNRRSERGDRHAIVVDPVNRQLYEFFGMIKTDAGWQAAQASRFDLATHHRRPEGWTSADAAGLPIFPLTVRFDELQRGIIDHPLRVTIRNTRRAHVFPASHYASRHTNPHYPRMGERFRLKQDFDVSGFSPAVQTILTALKRYGMIVADNGLEWAVSVTPDPRIPHLHEELRRVRGRDFEVVLAP